MVRAIALHMRPNLMCANVFYVYMMRGWMDEFWYSLNTLLYYINSDVIIIMVNIREIFILSFIALWQSL